MPKAIKKRIDKKESDAGIDINERLDDIKKEFEKRQKTLVSYGLAALSAAVVISGIALYRFNASDKAQKLEYDAYKAYYSLYQKDDAGTDKSKALELFKQAYDLKKSPRLLLFIADAQTEMSKFDEALKTLDDFTRSYSREEALMPLAYQKIAAVQLKKGNKEDAKKALEKITGSAGDILKDYALLNMGRILEQEGKKDEADAKYKELAEKFPESPYAEEVKAKMGVKKEG